MFTIVMFLNLQYIYIYKLKFYLGISFIVYIDDIFYYDIINS